MKKVFLTLSVLLSCGLFCACSSDSAESIDVYGTMNGNHEKQGEENENPTAVLGDINVLQVQSDNGDSEICLLDQPYYRGGYEELRLREDGSTYFVNHIIFTAFIRNSSLFDVLHIDIESGKIEDISGLKVGYTFESDKIRFEARDDSPVDGVVPVRVVPDYALGGQIQVVDKKIAADGKPYITLNIQNLKFHSSDLNRTFTLNATVDYEIDNNDYGENVDLEALLIPDEQLVFFMMDALNNEYQGRHMLFSDGPEEQECLIINSEQEFQDAYKGDWQLPSINFKYCTLVIGRTYGEHGGISLGDYELIDNGDTYQLNLTLNNNVNPNYTYTLDHVNLYFWKLYPKMENKPVIFNSTTQDVNLDPLGDDSAYAKIRNRWLLESYKDSDGTTNHVGDGWGDENYTIEFKENGRVEGRIGANTFSGNYSLPYWYVLDGKYDNWNGDYIYGIINLWDVYTTEVYYDDPLSEALSEAFKHVFNAIEFKIWTSGDKVYSLTIRTPDHESFGFFYENIKQNYGFK